MPIQGFVCVSSCRALKKIYCQDSPGDEEKKLINKKKGNHMHKLLLIKKTPRGPLGF